MALSLAARFWFEGWGELSTGFLSGLAGLAATVAWFGAFALSKKGMGWGDMKLAGVMGAATALAVDRSR